MAATTAMTMAVTMAPSMNAIAEPAGPETPLIVTTAPTEAPVSDEPPPPATGSDNVVVIESRLAVGFFENVDELQEPTQEELDSFMVQVGAYLSEIFTTAYDTFVDIEVFCKSILSIEGFRAGADRFADPFFFAWLLVWPDQIVIDSTFDSTTSPQLMIDFDAELTFEEGTEIPPQADLVPLMEFIEYDDFIQDFIPWDQTLGPFILMTSIDYTVRDQLA